MATPMFRDLSRALEAPEEGWELWSGIPADKEPAYAEEMFRKASDAALARENALPKTGYVPAGVGPMVEPSMESPLAPLPSGFRSRKPVEFTPDTAKMQGKLAGFLGGNQLLRGPEYGRPLSDEEFASEQERARKLMAQDGFARDIPVASAEGSKTLASTVPGSGGDEIGRLSMGQALVRALEGSGSVISGQNLRSGAADTLGERMKQIEALRAKREERAADVAQEQAQYEGANLATLTTQLAAFKDRPDIVAALQNLKPGAKYTKPSDFIKSAYQAVTNPPTVAGKEATAKKTGAQGDVAAATAVAVPEKVTIAEGKLAEDIRKNKEGEAIRWAAMNRAAQNAATKLTAGQPETVQKEVRATTQKLGDSVAKEYGEISSALKEADRSLVAIKNQPPDVFAKVMQATNLDSLNTPEERALFRSVGELRRAAQKAQSGLAVTENERAEFLQLFGANWLQSPTSLIEAIEWMRRKTKDKLDQSFATYRAQGSVGNTAVQAYREAGGVTPDAQFLLPFNERQPKTATAPAPAPSAAVQSGGMVKVRHAATGKTATVDRAKADEMLKRPGFEEVK
jgi:hypothetical protein